MRDTAWWRSGGACTARWRSQLAFTPHWRVVGGWPSRRRWPSGLAYYGTITPAVLSSPAWRAVGFLPFRCVRVRTSSTMWHAPRVVCAPLAVCCARDLCSRVRHVDARGGEGRVLRVDARSGVSPTRVPRPRMLRATDRVSLPYEGARMGRPGRRRARGSARAGRRARGGAWRAARGIGCGRPPPSVVRDTQAAAVDTCG